MRFLTAIVVAALALASAGAQASAGVLVGTVRDSTGGAIPGVRVLAQAGDSGQQSVSDKDGRYRFELPAGTYRIEAHLPGFRRTLMPTVIVVAGKEAQCDLTLRIGILTTVLYVLPGGLEEAVQKADVVAHFRIVRSSASELVGSDRNIVAIEHEVAVLTLLKGADPGMKPGPARLLQANAGTWFEDGRQHRGQHAPYQPGDELVALLRRGLDGRLEEVVGPHLTFRVTAGKVTQQGGPIKGFTNGMTLESFLELFRKLG